MNDPFSLRSSSPPIVIIGAGLTGSLLAIFLARRGYPVEVYEKRPDPRRHQAEEGRSINLALSHRGLKALQKMGLVEAVLQKAIPMRGRLVHSQEGGLTYMPYGKDQTEFINSISRIGLNQILLEQAEKYPDIRFHFETPCHQVFLKEGYVEILDTKAQEIRKVGGLCFFAADGAGSVVRQAMVQQWLGYQSTSEFLPHGYKELTFPPEAAGAFAMEPNALHIWPRGSFMLIALPNYDGSFTGTLFLAKEGPVSFAALSTPEAVTRFFETYFPDALALMPTVGTEFFRNPLGLLGTVRCQPWHFEDKFVLIGDAAHAIVPFYGQGMNASFEDCLVLDDILDKWEGDMAGLFAEFEKQRKPNADAIAALAIENFYEMRDGVAEPAFLRKKQLEQIIEGRYPDYHSKYSLVTFHPEISYAEAHRRGNQQDQFLLEICREAESIQELDIEAIYQRLKAVVGF